MAARVAALRGQSAASIATLVLYVGAVVVLTWPLAAHLGSHRPHAIPGMRMDSLYSVWAAAWATHALTTAPLTLPNANAYYPGQNAFFYGPHGLGLMPYFGPTFLVTGNPTLAANLAFLACIALTAWGLHRVVVRWTGSEPSGLVAGATFLTTPWVLWAWIPAVLHWATLLYFPWVIALAARGATTARHLVLLGTLVLLQCLTDPVFVTPAVLAPLGVIVVGRLLDRNERPRGLREAAVLTAAVLALLPLYVGYASVLGAEQGLSDRRSWRGGVPEWLAPFEPVIIADRLMLPLTLPWGRSNNFSPLGVPQVVLPLIGVGLASVLAGGEGPRRLRRPWLHSGLWVALGIIVSVPAVRIWDSAPTRSPFFLVTERVAPQLIHLVNSPERLGVGALMGLALLSGLAFAECGRRMGRRRAATALLAVAIIGLMAAEWRSRVRLPYPLVEPPTVPPAILTRLRDPGGPLLELPVRQDRGWHSLAMYRSTYHWRPILNGYSSYWPRGFEERMALARRLPDPVALELLRQQAGLDAVLVDTSRLPARNPWSALADGPSPNGLRLVARDGDMLLFSVGEPSAGAAGSP